MKLSDLKRLKFRCPVCRKAFGIDTWAHGAGSSSAGEIRASEKVQCWGCLSEVRADSITTTSHKLIQ